MSSREFSTENILNYSIVDGNCDEFLSYLSILNWNRGIVIYEDTRNTVFI